jgi:ankyrin repeat protein
LKEGYTPLHFASELGNEEAVKLFLNKGADINASTNGNLTPLHIATKTGRKIVVKLLLQHGAKVDNQDKDGKTTLHLAVEKGYLTIVEDVLRYCPDINDQSNRSSLKIAVHGYGEEYKKIVEALLEYGLIVNPEDANNPKLLHAAVEKGYLKIIEDLLKYGADVNTLYNSTFKEGFTPLHSAAKNKQEEVAKLLISYEADINAQDKTGKTPIFYAIENADLKITKLLLTNRANIKDSPDLLNIAVKKECIEIVEALLQHDADINASDKYGRTALHFTALSESEGFFGFLTNEDPDINIKGEIAKLLLSKGASVDAQTKNGVTTLHAAIQKGYVKVVEALLKYNANVNSGVKSDITPLHLSAQRGNEEISTMLLNKGANVNAKQKDGITALHIATQKGHKEVVKVLLECGAKVDSKIKSDITPLHLGAKKGYQEIIETILKFGANIDSRDDYGRTALHIASQEGHVEVVVTLLEYGSDINITSRNNHTPLDHAMAGIRSFHSQLNNYSSDDDGYYDPDRGVCSCEVTAEALKRQIVKMKTANLYVSEKNLLSMSSSGEISGFQDECEEEIARMKSEKINNPNISFYDILAKGTSSLAIYMRNENIVQVLKSDDYKKKFPIYASMIESHFRKGMERKELLEQGNKIFHFLFNNFPELPYDCTEKIFSYLSNEDLRILMDACKPLSISNPNTNINDVVITSSISQIQYV